MRRDLLVGVIATVVFVAAGVIAIVSLVARSRGTAAVRGTPGSIHAALVSADGRHITMTGSAPWCHVPHVTAQEDDRSVELTFTSQPYAGACQLSGGGTEFEIAQVGLAHALSGRALVDSNTGRPVRYFDGRNLWQLDYVPRGWRLAANLPPPYGPGSNGALGWTRQFESAESTMNVVQSYAPITTHDHGKPIATVHVGDQQVPLHYSSVSYTASWSSGSMYFAVFVNPTGSGDPAMSTGTVERVLAGMHR